jgi:RNA polymerase sigma-B factor
MSTVALQSIDEATLFERWRCDGDEEARDALAERYMPLARKLALRYVRSSEPLEDLVQVASLGLIKALRRFEAGRSNRFATFAVPTILGELRRYFRDSGWTVHVPRGTQERVLQVEKATRDLTGLHGRSPTVQDLAAYTELDIELVLEALQAANAYDALSLDAPRQGNDGEMEPLVESIGTEDARYDLVESETSVAAGFRLLSAREREILYLRFVHELTQSEIAARVGVSQMQISRVLRRSLAQLHDFAEGTPPAA